MLPTLLRRLAVLSALSFMAASPAVAEHPMIAKARAYLGPEAALNAVKSVHYMGSMLAPNALDPAHPTRVAIDIIFQAPFRQRTVRTTDSLVDTNALDTYDGWHRMQDPKNPSQWRLQLLPTDQIKRERAIVWENLGFYRGLEREGGKIIDQGPVTIAGVACRKLAFVHADDIIFYRYFDAATGRLVLTETEAGDSIREQGEIMVGGIRFAKMIINTIKDHDGKAQTLTIIFDQITLNESFPASTFEIPSFTGK